MTERSLRTGYHSWVLAIGIGAAGCSSGQAAPASGGSSGAVATPGTATSTTAAPSGALALNAKDAQRVSYTVDGAAKELLDFATDKVKISASCAKPDGTLDCEAIRLLRRGKTVQLTSAEMSRGIAPGAVICNKLKIQSTTGRDAKGNEDGFCLFADGSLVAHGSVDTHVLAP